MGTAATRRICVTGASGQAGRAVVRELLEHGYEVAATDIAATRDDLEAVGALRADLTDYGQALEALKGAGAVVHLANIPAPGICTPAVTFNANMTMNFNVFHAAASLGLSRVVWASSETTLGLFFGMGPGELPFVEAEGLAPRYAPVDEDHYPVPTATYALSKVASETIAGHIARSSRSVFPTSWFRATTRSFPRSGRIRRRASGTCGAMWMSGTWRRPAGWPSRRPRKRSQTARLSSSPRRTPS
jgi:nucleoside-diphosphate-sugar epimerase